MEELTKSHYQALTVLFRSMNFENIFLGPRFIQVCHLRSKTPLTIVDCLRGPPHQIQRGHKSPRVPPPPAPPSLQQPPAPPCLQRRRLRAEPAVSPAPARHARGHPVPCVPLAARRGASRPPLAARPHVLPAGATTVRPPFLTCPAGAACVAPALPTRALRARHWVAAAAPGAPVRALVAARAVAGCSAAGSPALPPPTRLRTAAVQPARRLHTAVNATIENLRTPAAAPLQ
jgi:hypothetical protein